MTSFGYEKVFRSFLGDVNDTTFVQLAEHETAELLAEHLHKAFAESYLRRCFSSLKLNDTTQTVTYELKHEVDADTDLEFVIGAATKMMVYKWWANKVNNINLAAQALVGAEQKMYSQSAHLAECKTARDSAKEEADAFIRDRNAMFNATLSGDRR